MRGRLRLLALWLCLVGAGHAHADTAVLPPQLTGIWATAESVIEREQLVGGTALYLLPSGQIALVGAPLPVRHLDDGTRVAPIIGIAGDAVFDASTGRLVITLRDGDRRAVVTALFDAIEQLIVLPGNGDQPARLSRRQPVVPAALAQMLQGRP